MEDMKILYEDLQSRINIEDPEDPRYLSTVAINSAVEMIEIFKRIPEAIANSGGHLNDASKKTLTESIGKIALFGDTLIGMYKSRVLEDSGVNLSDISNAPSMMHKFVSFRESNNIIVSYVAMTIDMANEAANNEYRELFDKWEKLDNNLVEWAKANGKSVQHAYNMLHRTTKSGKKLIRVFKESFSDEKNKYLKDFRNGTPEEKTIAKNWLLKNLELKPDAKVEYEKNLEEKKKALLGEYGSPTNNSYQRNLAYFIANNDVFNNSDAWGSYSYYKYLQFKPSVVEANYSPEYAELKKGGNELLLEFYEAWQKQMQDFDSMITGVTIPYNMIPNVHASPVEKWVEGKLGIKSVLRDLRLSLTLDVENEERSSKDTSRSIPLRYMQPLRDNAGNITPGFVSAELTPALLEFGMSVLRHKHRQNIQADVMMAQRILEGPKAQEYYEEGGERKLREVSAETKATLNKAIQMKLYDLGLGGTPNGKKVQAAMGLFSKIVMTIPIKSAAAAFVSGAIFGNSQLKSNPNFGEASLMEAMKFLFTNREKGNVIADYFNIYQEGDLRMQSRTMRHNFFTRWANDDYLYSPLRPTDEMGDRRMFIAMLSNYSIDEKGLFQRLEDLPIGAKSALEQIEVSNGKILTKILPSERTKMSMMFKAEMGAVRGSNTPMDIAEYQAEIFASAVMQFKGWMPAMLLGRYGDVKYDKYMYRMKEGRISGAYKSLKLKYSPEQLQDKTASSLLIASVAEKTYNVLAGLLSDKNYILTKREYERLEKGGKLNDKKIANFEKRREALRKEMDFIRSNSTDPHLVNMTEESFFRLREASVRSTLFEMRAILVVMLASMLLNGLADDDEDESYATQMGAVMLDRLLLEIRMFLNPFEILNLNNGIPVLGLLQMIQRIAFSSADITFQALTEDEVDFSSFNKAILSPLPGYSAYKFVAN
jgi:succinate dehydrogenase flavin-adding protein (antitoxin of CptAB toxin-antitoxin module)